MSYDMRQEESHRALIWVLGAITILGFAPSSLAQQGTPGAGLGTTQANAATLLKDVYPDSGFRLPLPKREDLDVDGKKMYDAALSPKTLAGLRGPAGIYLYSSTLAKLEIELNQYLRYEAGFSGRVRELAILVTPRESNSQFEWTVHEPQALKEGLDREIVDVVKYRKSSGRLPETEAVIIQLGREMFAQRRVASDTFARALKLFGPRGLVNLVSLMSNYSATATLLATFDMQLSSGQEPLLPLP